MEVRLYAGDHKSFNSYLIKQLYVATVTLVRAIQLTTNELTNSCHKCVQCVSQRGMGTMQSMNIKHDKIVNPIHALEWVKKLTLE